MKLLGFGLIGLLAIGLNQSSPLSTAEIEQAIRQAQDSKDSIGPSCMARMATSFFDLGGVGPNDGPFDVSIVGPVGRIMQAARAATRKHLPFAAADVTEALRAPVLVVTAMPQRSTQRSGITYRSGPATGLAVRSRPPKGEPALVVKPLSFYLKRVQVGLDSMEGQGITARFDLAAVAALPTAEIDLVVITQLSERQCKLSAADRHTIR